MRIVDRGRRHHQVRREHSRELAVRAVAHERRDRARRVLGKRPKGAIGRSHRVVQRIAGKMPASRSTEVAAMGNVDTVPDSGAGVHGQFPTLVDP